ncbi:hypothetical protein GCM10011390_41530 [Aureimonas endophytica]|uniref:NodB homology domain-containing protein n=2 Tax=Aureimonas endophytica TaxID=2027858 RepID=A0A916ZXJ9_9HYPH|nr:hypothetical protein GCM10011390_41530 [Aureimonas endophytica]
MARAAARIAANKSKVASYIGAGIILPGGATPTINSVTISVVTSGASWAAPRYGDVFEAIVDAVGLSADVYPIYSWRAGPQGTAPQSRQSMGEFEKRLYAIDSFNGLTSQVSVSLFSKSQNKVIFGPVHSIESGIFSGAIDLLDGFNGPLSEYALGGATLNATILTSGQLEGAGMLHWEGNGLPSVTPQITKNTALNIDPSVYKNIMMALDLQSEKSQSQVALAFGRSGTYQYFSPTSLGNGWPTGKRVVGSSQLEWNFPASHKGVAATTFRTNLSSQQSPYNTRLNFDALMGAKTGFWLFVLSFDDGFRDSYDKAFPLMQEAGLVGQLYLPCGPGQRIGNDEQGEGRVSDKLLVSEVRKLFNAGWAVGIDGTQDDLPMTGKTMADVKTGIDTMRSWLTGLGFPDDHTRDLCYPNGYYRGDAVGSLPAATGVPIMVTDGTAVVKFRDAGNANDVTLNVPNGWTCRGANIPDGVTVASGGGSAVSTVTLSQAIPAQAKAADFIDKSLLYYPPAMRNFLRDQCGILSARTTEQALWMTRGGPGDLALNFPSFTTSGKNYSDMLPNLNILENGGYTGGCYIHQLTSTASGGINFNIDEFKLLRDWLGNGQAQGKGKVVTMPTLRRMHWASTVAKMLAA